MRSTTNCIISGALHPPTLPTTDLCLKSTNKGLELFKVASLMGDFSNPGCEAINSRSILTKESLESALSVVAKMRSNVARMTVVGPHHFLWASTMMIFFRSLTTDSKSSREESAVILKPLLFDMMVGRRDGATEEGEASEKGRLCKQQFL